MDSVTRYVHLFTVLDVGIKSANLYANRHKRNSRSEQCASGSEPIDSADTFMCRVRRFSLTLSDAIQAQVTQILSGDFF